MGTTWIDDNGHEHGLCAFCGADCSTHPDAADPLAPCGDCGAVTCLDHRVEDQAARCVDCAAQFYQETDEDEDDSCPRCGGAGEVELEGTDDSRPCPDCGVVSAKAHARFLGISVDELLHGGKPWGGGK